MARRFNPPPNWPSPPQGWTPPPEWQPDPSWEPVPKGWELWIDEPRDASDPRKRTKGPVLLVGGAVAAGVAIVVGAALAAGGGSDDGPSADADSSVTVVEKTRDAAEEEASRRAEEEAQREAAEEAARQAEEEAQREAEQQAQRRAEEDARREAEEEARAAAEAERLDPSSYAAISDRDWALVERDPDAHAGNRYVLYGRVTQFDSNTGPDNFRVNTAGEPKRRSYEYDVNTIAVATDQETVANVVTDDLVTMHVEVLGAFSYTTTLGGETSVPLVQVNIISVDGSA